MILDGQQQAHGTTMTTDVCIVGAGPAGIAMALELQGSGLQVLVLEAGGRTETKDEQRMARGESVGLPYFPLDKARIRAFAGSSNHWREWSGMRARPFDPLDFEARPDVGRDGWPFDRTTLDPHYERAQELCDLGPFDYRTATWSDTDAPPLGLDSSVAETVTFQVAALGAFPARWSAIEGDGDTTLLLHAHVLEIVTGEGVRSGRTEHLAVAAGPGHRFTVEATVFVLACGGLENPRLMLASRGSGDHGVGNGRDVVGRYFMEHPHVNTGVVVPSGRRIDTGLYERRVTDGTDTISMVKLTDAILRREGLLTSAWSLVPTSSVKVSPTGRALVGLKESVSHRAVLPGTFGRLKSLVGDPKAAIDVAAQVAGLRKKASNDLVQLSMMSEQLPNPSSRVLLSDRRDRLGSPLTKLDWRLSDLDHHTISRTQALLGEAFEAAGVGRIEQRYREGDDTPIMNGGYHMMGATRMHESPAKGVVDADGRVHGVENLYVAGMSVFPTAGFANPTLTVVALAVRLAAHLRKVMAASINVAPEPGA